MSASKETIKVFCRLRGLNQREQEGGYKPCVTSQKDTLKLTVKESI